MYLNSSHPSSGMYPARTLDMQCLARNTLAVVLAGGKGTRLGALTLQECKPALPFGAFYRNIDFSLSNCINSGIHRIGVATQYRDASLIQHLLRVWRHSGEHGEGFVEPWRAERSNGAGAYRGTADAVFQNWGKIAALDAQLVLILAGDHVYKMDYRPMLRHHMARGADVTVGCVEIPVESATEFGVMSIDGMHRVLSFSEKPRQPESMPGRPDRALASMGIYVFNRQLLGRLLRQDALTQTSSHDFGRDVLPGLIGEARVVAYPFAQDAAVGAGYWRDVGTVAAYWRTHMDLLDGVAGFRLEDTSWPIRSDPTTTDLSPSSLRQASPAGNISHSMIAGDCSIEDATVRHSVLFANVSVAANTELANAVVLPGAIIGRYCCLNDVVIGAGARIPDGTVVTPMRLHDGANAPAPGLLTTDTVFSMDTPARPAFRRTWQRQRELHEGPRV